ncbi:hypothetical protein [Nocardia cyriacigeorgica]|uniref:hypothetical protein n=1 Tax=Nocardia cyriacigeorgica TaxID=135487 RepID=UPI0024562AA6|nr:hypothetical protein [Nocardia cyriacigeorgica]
MSGEYEWQLSEDVIIAAERLRDIEEGRARLGEFGKGCAGFAVAGIPLALWLHSGFLWLIVLGAVGGILAVLLLLITWDEALNARNELRATSARYQRSKKAVR